MDHFVLWEVWNPHETDLSAAAVSAASFYLAQNDSDNQEFWCGRGRGGGFGPI